MIVDQEIKRLRLELAAWRAEAKALRETMAHIATLIDVNKKLVEILDRAVIPLKDVPPQAIPVYKPQYPETVYPILPGTLIASKTMPEQHITATVT